MMYVADFETTVDDDTLKQESTEVWAYGISRLFDGTEDVEIGNCIEDFFTYLARGEKRHRKIVYFHNIKFDGTFIIDYLTRELGFVPAYSEEDHKYEKDNDIKPGEFSCVITDLGIWYSIIVNYNGYIIAFRDSLKLLPFNVKDLGPAFDTKYRKLEMDYKGNMKAGGIITRHQMDYISIDVLVVKEALEKFFNEIGVSKQPPLTISQAALKHYKSMFKAGEWNSLFPNLANVELDEDLYGSKNADEYIRKSYLGGWCYVDERYTGIVNGYTEVYDVNSLYPSVMRDHENPYPIGLPYFTKNNKDILKFPKDSYYFIRFKCKFELKPGYLPFIQLKHDAHYRSNENLRSSKYDLWGHLMPDYKPTITLSRTLFVMFLQGYKVTDMEFLDMCIFNTEVGIFDSYVDHYIEMKERAGEQKNKVKRTIAKLFLNSLYGKFAKSPENSFKIPVFNENNEIVDYVFDKGPDKEPLYIPVASSITSYARRFTLRAAILNREYFRYSDTDSIHICPPKGYTPKGIKIHDSHLNCWKLENKTENSIFVRQKTYIEFTEDKDNKDLSYYDIKACGMPERCKMLIEQNLKRNFPDGDLLTIPQYDSKGEIFDYQSIFLSEKEVSFMSYKMDITDFHNGFSVPGKLLPKLIKGGTVLTEVDFTIN